MRHFLFEQKIDLPVISTVVITTHASIIYKMPEKHHIFKLDGLRLKLKEWLEIYPKKVSNNVLQLLHMKLMEQYSQQKWQHPLKNVKLIEGALCECGQVMAYSQGKFKCSCGRFSKDTLYKGLHDYRLLVNEWITNREFRTFLKLIMLMWQIKY